MVRVVRYGEIRASGQPGELGSSILSAMKDGAPASHDLQVGTPLGCGPFAGCTHLKSTIGSKVYWDLNYIFWMQKWRFIKR